MPDIKTSDMTDGGAVGAGDLVHVARPSGGGFVDRKVNLRTALDSVAGGGGGGSATLPGRTLVRMHSDFMVYHNPFSTVQDGGHPALDNFKFFKAGGSNASLDHQFTEGNAVGITRLSVGAVNDRASLSNEQTWIAQNGKINFESRIRIPSFFGNGSQTWELYFGLMTDWTADNLSAAGCFFHATGDVFRLRVFDSFGGEDSETSDAATVGISANEWFRIAGEINADGSGSIAINDSDLVEAFAAGAIAPAQPHYFALGAKKTGGANTIAVDVDYMTVQQVLAR